MRRIFAESLRFRVGERGALVITSTAHYSRLRQVLVVDTVAHGFNGAYPQGHRPSIFTDGLKDDQRLRFRLLDSTGSEAEAIRSALAQHKIVVAKILERVRRVTTLDVVSDAPPSTHYETL